MEEIEVKQSEYKKAQAPDILYSGGLGPCIVVGAIYRGNGFMVHMPDPLCEEYLLESLLKDLRKGARNRRDLKIYVAGGGRDSGEDEDYNRGITENRKLVLEKIAKEGFESQIQEVRWNNLNCNQTLTLFLAEGRAEYEENSDEDLETEDQSEEY